MVDTFNKKEIEQGGGETGRFVGFYSPPPCSIFHEIRGDTSVSHGAALRFRPA
jgi:hypothetical protein